MFDDGGYGGYDPRNPFPHDGEGKDPCTGYGCDCDEKNYGSYHSHKGSSSSGTGGGVIIAFIAALIFGYAVNELLGAIIIIGLIIYVMAK